MTASPNLANYTSHNGDNDKKTLVLFTLYFQRYLRQY